MPEISYLSGLATVGALKYINAIFFSHSRGGGLRNPECFVIFVPRKTVRRTQGPIAQLVRAADS